MGRLKSFPFPLPLTAGDLDTLKRWTDAEHPEQVDEIESLRESGAALAVPLLMKNGVAGILLLGAPEGRARYSTAGKESAAELRGAVRTDA